MADKWYTAASGNWSTAANWNGGTLPVAGDDVYADGKAVVIDQTVNVGSIRTTQRTGGTIVGTFTVSTAQSITCTGAGIIANTGTNGAVIVSASTGTVTIISNIIGGSVVSSWGVYVTGNATVNVTGNVTGGSNSSCIGLYVTSNGVVSVTGNVTGSTGITNAYGVFTQTGSPTINITGNVTANAAGGIGSNSAATAFNVVGTITSSNTVSGILFVGNTTPVVVSGPMVNVGSINAVYAQKIRIYASAVTSWTYQNEYGGTKVLYSAGVSLGNPAEADVRNGTVYGASGELTGTLIVPSPSDVLSGVPTDHTVGTYSSTPAGIATEVWNTLLASITTSGSIGKLIKDYLDVAVSTRLAAAGYTAPDNAGISAIKAKTDNLPADPASETSVDQVPADTIALLGTSTEPVAIRLRNVATVETTGAQIASFPI